jgi:hypothetical protein
MENAKKFSATELFPRILEDYRRDTFDTNILKLMGQNGFLGCTLN